MATSGSEDFESADEGHGSPDTKQRKKRLSSSNYSDNALEADAEPASVQKKTNKAKKPVAPDAFAHSWGDFEIDEPKPPPVPARPTAAQLAEYAAMAAECRRAREEALNRPAVFKKRDYVDSDWDEFGNWKEENNFVPIPEPTEPEPAPAQPDRDIKEVTDRLAAASTSGGSRWGWGWSADLLNTASAGISNITSQVSQGISTVLETSIGAPDPEELARLKAKEREEEPKAPRPDPPVEPLLDQYVPPPEVYQFVYLFTNFVGSTGTRVISGGLDTLEIIGKKTMEVLQDGDPGLAKKRAMIGLGNVDKPVLSQVLKEAKAKADEEDKIREEKREAKEVHYENLFDDFEGLVHLEALEMLSKQVHMRIAERLRSIPVLAKRQEIKETLQQVAELCEMPEEEEEDEEPASDLPKPDAFHVKLRNATQDFGFKLQFLPLVNQYAEILDFISSDTEHTVKSIYKRAVSSLAQATALAVEQYHKAAEMLLVKTRRSTADEADALTQMTVTLTKHISELATLFTEKLNALPADDKEQVNDYITNIFLEAGNSSTYIQNAFQLALPILQSGAV